MKNSNGITDYNALNFYGNYNNTWGKHEVTVMGGFNQESSDYRYAEMSRMNMINEDLPSISQATGDYFAKDKFERYTVRGLFYRINYSFAGKYLRRTDAMTALPNFRKTAASVSSLPSLPDGV